MKMGLWLCGEDGISATKNINYGNWIITRSMAKDVVSKWHYVLCPYGRVPAPSQFDIVRAISQENL